MAAAMAAAAAAGTQHLPSTTTTAPRLLPILQSPVFSPRTSSVVISRNSTNLVKNLRCPSRNPSHGAPPEHVQPGLTKLGGAGFTGGLPRRKYRVAAVVAGQYGSQASRDRVVEFGKYKGAMMGTLTSRYLKWMVKNLKAGPLSEWSTYAEEVLADPYYKDRLEWEKVEKLMTAAHDIGSITGNREVVLAPARVYGWDLQDEDGWRKVKFSFIGTSQGGRIPRTKGVVAPAEEKKKAAPRKKKPVSVRDPIKTTRMQSASPSAPTVDDSYSAGSLRDELLRRRALRRDRLMSNRGSMAGDEEAEGAQRALRRFPGRESLLDAVKSYDISEWQSN